MYPLKENCTTSISLSTAVKSLAWRLVGSGRTELARCIFGADPNDAGRFAQRGTVEIRQPSDAKAAGIALIPEDRRKQALVPVMDVERNFGLANYRQYAPQGFCGSRAAQGH